MKDIAQYYSDLVFMFTITIMCIGLLVAVIKGIMILFSKDESEPLIPTLESILYSQLPAPEKINKIISLVNETK